MINFITKAAPETSHHNQQPYKRLTKHRLPVPLRKSSRDFSTVKLFGVCTGRTLLISSSNLPYDDVESKASGEMTTLLDHTGRSGSELVIGCDANSHNEAAPTQTAEVIPSLSDHGHTCFKIGKLEKVQYKNPRNTDWVSYKKTIRVQLEFAVQNSLASAIVGSFDLSCPITNRRRSKIAWRSSELASLRKRTGRNPALTLTLCKALEAISKESHLIA
ncbi:hypothetical protein J6590_052786 [Homalodisca vitripennis]|nr:hypothetical protein J6590_052786 [Homalodisca vitripennis]